MGEAATQQQMAAFEQYMQVNFVTVHDNIVAGHQPGYQVIDDRINHAYNCIAYAVNVTTRKLTPQTEADLETLYAPLGYFPVAVQGLPSANDVEVYFKPASGRSPQHAHRVINATTCHSKIGDDVVISHGRDLMQCRKPGNSGQFAYGTVGARFRFDQAKLDEYNNQYTETSSGRKIKKSQAALSNSGKRTFEKSDASTTKSGRVFKKPKQGTSTQKPDTTKPHTTLTTTPHGQPTTPHTQPNPAPHHTSPAPAPHHTSPAPVPHHQPTPTPHHQPAPAPHHTPAPKPAPHNSGPHPHPSHKP